MKKLLSLMLIITFMLNLAIINVQIANAEEPSDLYTDVKADYWAYKTIEKCKELNIFSGYPDGDFRPENNILRAEALKAVSCCRKKSKCYTRRQALWNRQKCMVRSLCICVSGYYSTSLGYR